MSSRRVRRAPVVLLDPSAPGSVSVSSAVSAQDRNHLLPQEQHQEHTDERRRRTVAPDDGQEDEMAVFGTPMVDVANTYDDTNSARNRDDLRLANKRTDKNRHVGIVDGSAPVAVDMPFSVSERRQRARAKSRALKSASAIATGTGIGTGQRQPNVPLILDPGSAGHAVSNSSPGPGVVGAAAPGFTERDDRGSDDGGTAAPPMVVPALIPIQSGAKSSAIADYADNVPRQHHPAFKSNQSITVEHDFGRDAGCNAAQRRQKGRRKSDGSSDAESSVGGVDKRREVEEDEASSSSGSDSEAASMPFVPTFRRAETRSTLLESTAARAREEAMSEAELRRHEQVVIATKTHVAEAAARRQKNGGISSDEELTYRGTELSELDTDEEDLPAERAEWRLREEARVRRHAEEKRRALESKLELERRHRMTDAEIMAEDADKFAAIEARKNASRSYLQKYYHAGAFFRTFDEDDITAKWDFSAPVLEDKIDKSALPAPLQVRRDQFGKAGRSKYTHLKDQDTSSRNSLFDQAQRASKRRKT